MMTTYLWVQVIYYGLGFQFLVTFHRSDIKGLAICNPNIIYVRIFIIFRLLDVDNDDPDYEESVSPIV